MIRRHSDAEILRILRETRTVAVVGVSKDEFRPSHYVARFLRERGYRIVPVNPAYAGETLLGETVRASLADIPPELGDVEMVDIFRRPDRAGAVVDEALAHLLDRGLRTIWMQIGVVDQAAAARAEAKGLTVVMDLCPKIELHRLGQQPRQSEIALERRSGA